MICNIDNEAMRLNREVTPGYMPFAVSIYLTDKSRSPIFVRRRTLHAAMCFVEDVTGLGAIRWVTNTDNADQLYCFTGKHERRYDDVKQWRPVPSPVLKETMDLCQCPTCGGTGSVPQG
jgi:hypothetical protein